MALAPLEATPFPIWREKWQTMRHSPQNCATEGGKGAARATRRTGRVPGVIYGGKTSPEMISIDRGDLTKIWNTGRFLNQITVVDVAGKETRAIARDVQLHPVTDTPLHVDFLRLEAGARVKLSIPVNFNNEGASPGIKRGGVLNIVRYEVELDCPADNIPTSLEADLTGLEIGDSLHISAINLPDGVQPTITDRDFTVATVAAPSKMATAEETEAAEGDAAEGDAAAAEGGDSEEKSD